MADNNLGQQKDLTEDEKAFIERLDLPRQLIDGTVIPPQGQLRNEVAEEAQEAMLHLGKAVDAAGQMDDSRAYWILDEAYGMIRRAIDSLPARRLSLARSERKSE